MRPILLVTIDVESDDLWATRRELTFENIRRMPRLHAFLESHGVRPTYLVTYPVATSAEGRAVLGPIARGGVAEIGSHMHVWTTPPFKPLTSEDFRYCPFATELPFDLHYEKLATATRAVAELTGSAPRSHRAGRYGFDGNGLRALMELGYTVDTSVTPLRSWRERAHDGGWRGPDFTRAPLEPYYPDPSDVARPGKSSLLEVPASFFYTRALPRSMARLVTRLPRENFLLRALNWSGLLRAAWLRPGREVSGPMLVGIGRALIAAGAPVLNVSLHSSEMVLGTSPHTPRDVDVNESYDQLAYFFKAVLRDMNGRAMTLSELAADHAAFRSGGD